MESLFLVCSLYYTRKDRYICRNIPRCVSMDRYSLESERKGKEAYACTHKKLIYVHVDVYTPYISVYRFACIPSSIWKREEERRVSREVLAGIRKMRIRKYSDRHE